MEKRKVLVTGSQGMLGRDIVSVFSGDEELAIFGTDKITREPPAASAQIIGDLTDPLFLRKTLEEVKPDIVVHCAAIVNVDECERNRELADRVHAEATRMLISCRPLAGKFVYISTDSVFDGEKGNYTEEDSPNPINGYARSKLAGERIALESRADVLVIRTNIFGFNYPAGNSLAQWAIGQLSEGIGIRAFSDVYFNPIYTKQLARIVLALVRRPGSPILINVAGDYCISKYDFILSLARVFGYPEDLVSRSSIEDAALFAPRPKRTTLNIGKLKKVLGTAPGLEEGLTELRSDYSRFFPTRGLA